MSKVSGKIFDLKLFNKLFVFIKPFKFTYYFVGTTAILLSLFSTLTPYLLKITVDDYIRPKNYSGMLFLIVYVSLLYIGSCFSVFICFLCKLVGTKSN